MPQRIEVPGMGILEFPDGMSDADMANAIKRNMPQPKAEPMVDVDGMGKAALIAAGRGTDKIVQGVRQAYNWATGDQATLDKMASSEQEKDSLYKPLAEKYPVSTSIGEITPSLAAGVMTGGTSLLGGAAAGAIPSMLSYGSGEERLKRGAVDAAGGAGGVLLGRGVARLLKPAGAGVAGVSNDALQAASRIGYKPTPAQISKNPGMLAFENYLLRSPGSSGAMQSITQANQEAVNRAGARAMGETASDLGEATFAGAQRRIGGEFDRLGQITKPDLSGGFLTTLAKVDSDNLARGAFSNKKVTDLVDKGLDLASKNNLDGKAYKEIRTELQNEAQAAFRNGDSTVGKAYKSMVSALDDAAKASLSPADRKAWDVARKEWGAFKTMTKSNVAEAGDLSPARTAAALRARGPFLRTGEASGELADVARIGEAFKGVSNPNSGQLAQQALYSSPLTALPLMAGNKIASSAYLSPLGQRYFSRGILDVGEGGRQALTRSSGLLGIPASRAYFGAE